MPVQAQPDVRVGEQHDADGEREHDQFGPAPPARQRQPPGQARLGRGGAGPVAGRPHSAHEEPPAPVPLVADGPGQPDGVVGWVSLNFGAWTVPLFFGNLCGWRSPHFCLYAALAALYAFRSVWYLACAAYAARQAWYCLRTFATMASALARLVADTVALIWP